MLIGMTYDLRSEYLNMGYSMDETAEFDRDDTMDAIASALADMGHQTDRIGNAKALAARLVRGDRWDMVFNIAEGLQGIGREAQVPAILDLYGVPYTFSDPLVMALTLHKAMTKRVVRDAGLATADFFLFEAPGDARNVCFEPPYFIKPVSEGTGKGTSPASIIQDRRDLAEACSVLQQAYAQPVLVEPYLPGREFTVGIIGTGSRAAVLGTLEVQLCANAEQGVYSYNNKENSEKRVRYSLVRAAEDPVVDSTEVLAVAAWRVLGCRDAGRVDIRCDHTDTPMFIEVNPLAGLHPTHSDLPIICSLVGMPYTGLIQEIVASAVTRCAAMRPRTCSP